MYDIIDWTPNVYVPSTEEEADARTIEGNLVSRKEFDSYFNYYKFLEKNDSRHVYENKVKNEIQFLTGRYYGIPDEEMYVPNLKVYYIDIETEPGEGFPDWKNPKDAVILCSVRNSVTKETVTFGYDPISYRKYTGDRSDIKYIRCDSEEDLIRRFFTYMHKFPCDVLSGFNIHTGFDIPYLINRAKVLWGEEVGTELYNRMSPINKVNVWKQKNSDDLNIDIAGVTVLDYIDLYKKYGKKLERYSLEYISQKELKKGKLVNSYGSMKAQIENDWNEFVEYNVIDCERVNDLEDKLGYIKMIQSLSLLCKTPMKYYIAQTQLIEGLMLTYFRRTGQCAPHFSGGEQEPYEAAYIKEPQIGLHKWNVDVDITSSYPSHIITLNMSIETFFGRIIGFTEEQVISCVKKRKFTKFKISREINGEWKLISFEGNKLDKFNSALKRGLFAIAPCGSVFTTTKPGVIAIVQKSVFFKRKDVKDLMKKFGNRANICEGEEKKKCKEEEKKYDSLQKAIKIMMNAFYGILAVPYSRYHNINISEAITSCARRTIRSGEIFANTLLNNPNEELKGILNEIDEYVENKRKEETDFIVYIHTDSLFLNLNSFILDSIEDGDKWIKLSDEEKIEYIKRISRAIEKYINNRIFNEVQINEYNSQVHDFKIGFKQEIIAKTILIVKKSKYAYWLLNKEGVPKDSIEVTGLELIRSETAEAIRPRLKEIMEMIMKEKSDEEIFSAIKKYKKELKQLDPGDLAANIGVNGIKEYLGTGTPKKGTPWHVKGVHGYNLLLNELGIKNEYEEIQEGLKAKVVYVKSNPYGVQTISFYQWPSEFDTIIQLDSDKMIEKFFIKKVRMLLEPAGREDILFGNKSAVKAFF